MENLLLLLILLLLSFIFSGYETAFFAMSSVERDRLSIRYPTLNLEVMHKDKGTILNIILLMNLLVNTINSFNFAYIIESLVEVKNLSSEIILLYQIGGFFIILLVFGEITPKVIAIYNPSFFVKNFSRFIYIIYLLCGWFIRPLSLFFKLIFSKHRNANASLESALKELKILFPKVYGIFAAISIIKGTVKRLMREKRHVVHFLDGMKKEDIEVLVKKYPHSMYPVLKDGEVSYIVNLRKSRKESFYLEEPVVIPDTTTILEYLKEVGDDKKGFRVVVSEYGEYIGIVTLDDIIKIFSSDESIKKVSEKVFIVEGRASLEDIESTLGITFDGESETLMGYLMKKTNKILQEGEKVVINSIKFEVLLKERGEIKLVRIELL